MHHRHAYRPLLAGDLHLPEKIQRQIRIAGQAVMHSVGPLASRHQLHQQIDVLHHQIARNVRVVLADVVALGTARMQHRTRFQIELVHFDIRWQRVACLIHRVQRVDVVGAKMPLQERLEKTRFQPWFRLRPRQRQRGV